MKTRRLLALALPIALATVLAACGAPGGETGGEATTTAAEEVGGSATGTLKIGGTEADYMDAVVQAFQAAHPEIDVEYSTLGVNFEGGGIQTLLRSGSGPDVLLVNSGPGRVGLLSESGLIRPLDDVYAEHGLEEVYESWIVDQIRAQGDGTIYEIVEGVGVYQVYYNTTIFNEVGIDPPQTWEDFLANCDDLQEAGVLPIVAGVRDNFAGGWMFGQLLQASAGTEIMSEVIYEGGSFAQPEVLRGAEMLATLLEEGCIDGSAAAALDALQAKAAFIDGQGAMAFVAQELPGEAEAAGANRDDFSSFLMPSPDPDRPATPTAGLGYSWVMNADTENVAAASEWMAWVASEEYLALTAENGLVQVPARTIPSGVTIDPALASSAEARVNGAGFNPSVYLEAGAVDAYYAAIQGIFTGQMSPQQAMEQIDAARQ